MGLHFYLQYRSDVENDLRIAKLPDKDKDMFAKGRLMVLGSDVLYGLRMDWVAFCELFSVRKPHRQQEIRDRWTSWGLISVMRDEDGFEYIMFARWTMPQLKDEVDSVPVRRLKPSDKPEAVRERQQRRRIALKHRSANTEPAKDNETPRSPAGPDATGGDENPSEALTGFFGGDEIPPVFANEQNFRSTGDGMPARVAALGMGSEANLSADGDGEERGTDAKSATSHAPCHADVTPPVTPLESANSAYSISISNPNPKPPPPGGVTSRDKPGNGQSDSVVVIGEKGVQLERLREIGVGAKVRREFEQDPEITAEIIARQIELWPLRPVPSGVDAISMLVGSIRGNWDPPILSGGARGDTGGTLQDLARAEGVAIAQMREKGEWVFP